MPVGVARVEGYDALRASQYQDAIEHFGYCVEKHPDDWRSQYFLGKAYLAQRKPAKARPHLETALTIRKNLSSVRVTLGEGEPDTYVPWPERSTIVDALAKAMHREGAKEELLRFLRRVAREQKSANAYIRLGKYLKKYKDHDAALRAFQQATHVAEPGDERPFVALASFYDAVGDREKAATQLRKAYSIKPDDPDIRKALRSHGLVPGPTIALPPEPVGERMTVEEAIAPDGDEKDKTADSAASDGDAETSETSADQPPSDAEKNPSSSGDQADQ